jgi:nucleotide-binding universal stress UspA family protein
MKANKEQVMLRTMVVPLDGSTFGEQALPPACALASRAGAVLRLVHVHTSSAAPIYIEGEPVIDENLGSLHHKHERLYLEQIQKRLAAQLPSLRIEVEVYDRPLESIVNEAVGAFLARQLAEHAEVDLVVMTTHGRGGISRLWLGSVAEALVRLSHVPVLLVRPQDSEADFAHLPVYRKILIPLDGSALAEQILAPALELGRLMAAEYTLLQVIEPLYPAYNQLAHSEELDETAVQAAQQYLQQVSQQLATAGQPVQIQTPVTPATAQAILEVGASHDLIALATHGRSGWQRLLVGSVADKVLRAATQSVLVYRPQESQSDS